MAAKEQRLTVVCACAQLEEAAVRELQSQNVQEPGAEEADYSDLQVLLTSSQDFGPASIRELTVRSRFWDCNFSQVPTRPLWYASRLSREARPTRRSRVGLVCVLAVC